MPMLKKLWTCLKSLYVERHAKPYQMFPHAQHSAPKKLLQSRRRRDFIHSHHRFFAWVQIFSGQIFVQTNYCFCPKHVKLTLILQVGDGDTDHYCWQRPEDMTTSRRAYKIDEDHPGSDVAGETAAAMAAASIVFRRTNPHYSQLLLDHAQQVS